MILRYLWRKYWNKYNPNKKPKLLILFDGVIAYMRKKNIHPIAAKLLIRGSKLNISFVFITKIYFAIPKSIRLNSTDYFIMKIKNWELQQIAINHSLDIDFKYFMNLYKNFTGNPYYF